MEYHGQRILPGHKGKSHFFSPLMELTSYGSGQSEEAAKKWRHDRMDRDGFTSQRQTAQMEKNESEECCMAEKNQSIRGIVTSEHLDI